MATNGYPFKEWNAGDVITKNALNNMEHGIADVVLIQETDPAIDNNVYSNTFCFKDYSEALDYYLS